MFILYEYGKGDFIDYDSKGEASDRFKALSRKYNDNHYEEIILDPRLQYDPRIFFSESIKSITITCDKDLDAAHPAGSSLNDMIIFFSASPDIFLRDGKMIDTASEVRKQEYAQMDNRFKCYVKPTMQHLKYLAELICRKLSEVDFTEFQLVGGAFNLGPGLDFAYFVWEDTRWNTLSDYTFTVTILFEDGVERVASLHVL